MSEPFKKAQAAEITRLRAELAAAIKWRDAINDALTSWHNPVDEEENPREAVDRLIGYETAWERISAPDEATALQKRVAVLEGALREMVYEATHLSPQEDDGSHWAKISKGTLEKARAALTGGKDE